MLVFFGIANETLHVVRFVGQPHTRSDTAVWMFLGWWREAMVSCMDVFGILIKRKALFEERGAA